MDSRAGGDVVALDLEGDNFWIFLRHLYAYVRSYVHLREPARAPEHYALIRWMSSANDASSESGLDKLMDYITVFELVTIPVRSSFCQTFFNIFCWSFELMIHFKC